MKAAIEINASFLLSRMTLTTHALGKQSAQPAMMPAVLLMTSVAVSKIL